MFSARNLMRIRAVNRKVLTLTLLLLIMSSSNAYAHSPGAMLITWGLLGITSLGAAIGAACLLVTLWEGGLKGTINQSWVVLISIILAPCFFYLLFSVFMEYVYDFFN